MIQWTTACPLACPTITTTFGIASGVLSGRSRWLLIVLYVLLAAGSCYSHCCITNSITCKEYQHLQKYRTIIMWRSIFRPCSSSRYSTILRPSFKFAFTFNAGSIRQWLYKIVHYARVSIQRWPCHVRRSLCKCELQTGNSNTHTHAHTETYTVRIICAMVKSWYMRYDHPSDNDNSLLKDWWPSHNMSHFPSFDHGISLPLSVLSSHW